MKKRHVLKALNKVAKREALANQEQGTITIFKTKCGWKYIVRIQTESRHLGILIDRNKGPFNTWSLPRGL